MSSNTSQKLDEADDATLVQRVTAGDRQAFALLYQRHSVPLYRTVLAITRDAAPAEELLQECFLRAYRYIHRVHLEPGASLRPWLHRIVVNLAYDWSAKQRGTTTEALDGVIDRLVAGPGRAPERHAEQRETSRRVQEAIAELPFKQRIVVVLFYIHDMDLDEISTILNLPAGTVKSRLFYARARLREVFAADPRITEGLEVSYAPVTG